MPHYIDLDVHVQTGELSDSSSGATLILAYCISKKLMRKKKLEDCQWPNGGACDLMRLTTSVYFSTLCIH